jgi:hypothetical protein
MPKCYKNRHLRPSKSGDEVLRQLDEDEAIVFRLVGSDVRASKHMTRLEAWYQWIHDNPGDFALLLSEHHEREAQREHDAHKLAQALEHAEDDELAYALSVAREAPEWSEEANPHDEAQESASVALGVVALPFDASALPLPPDVDAWAEVRDDELRVMPTRARWTIQRDPRRYRARTALPAHAFMCDTRTHYGR